MNASLDIIVGNVSRKGTPKSETIRRCFHRNGDWNGCYICSGIHHYEDIHPMNCQIAGMPLCWTCREKPTATRFVCSIEGFRSMMDLVLNPITNTTPKEEIVRGLQGKCGSHPMYLRKALEIYHPQYVDMFDRLSILI